MVFVPKLWNPSADSHSSCPYISCQILFLFEPSFLSIKTGFGSLVIETMTAIDDFESFVNFMDNAAGDDSSDNIDDDDSRGEEEEGKRCRRQDSQGSECGRRESAGAARSRRK